MTNPDKLFGRLGNRMFQMAALYTWTAEKKVPFYVQDEKYFKGREWDIRVMYGQGIVLNGIDRVAIHVRRAGNPTNTDEPAYTDNEYYINLSATDYYKRAMDLFPNEKFLIFSDDIAWCKQNPLFQGCEFSEGKTEVEDLNAMASCKHNIIANSSFSWWAAWLNLNPDKKVIAPAKWFTDSAYEYQIGIPITWQRI